MTLREISVAVATASLLAACSDPNGSGAAPDFLHELTSEVRPWNHDEFDVENDKFTFGVFSDLNGGERDGVFNVAMAQLSLLRPEFILSIGDLIDGGTEDRIRLKAEWDSFVQRADKAIAPVFYVGGNHDLTNQTMRDVWMERFGARYYHFIYKNVLFLVLDSEDFGAKRMHEIYHARVEYVEIKDGLKPGVLAETKYAGMPESKTGEIGLQQSEYFLDVITRNADVRWTLLFMHKPVWRKQDEPEFEAIEAALLDRPYTVFNGHDHNYVHTVKNDRDHITLGTTGGTQSSNKAMSIDHVTLVTMTNDGPSIANLRMKGIFDKTGHIPLNGDDLCFEPTNGPHVSK